MTFSQGCGHNLVEVETGYRRQGLLRECGKPHSLQSRIERMARHLRLLNEAHLMHQVRLWVKEYCQSHGNLVVLGTGLEETDVMRYIQM
jgi:hypothetical protein